jgi:hypothetical protein
MNNTPRILESRLAVVIQDEGIVQPVSKETDRLSRRLHQCPDAERNYRSAFSFLGDP